MKKNLLRWVKENFRGVACVASAILRSELCFETISKVQKPNKNEWKMELDQVERIENGTGREICNTDREFSNQPLKKAKRRGNCISK